MKIAYTIATANYLAQAKTLGDSLLEHNPDYLFIIGLLDKIEGRFEEASFYPHQIMEIEKINNPYFAEMSERYTIFELSNALKPYVADYILTTFPVVDIVLYFDSDMMVFSKLTHVEQSLLNKSICLTAHILSPIPPDKYIPAEVNFLQAGMYNGGFFGLRPSKQTFDFINWWKNKLRNLCFVKADQGLFVDQIWLNFVPIYFDEAIIIRHTGYNVAFYNMHERFLSFDGQNYSINNNEPLVLFHFTGFDIDNIFVISKWQNRFKIENRLDIKPLLILYKEKLIKNKYDYYNRLISYYSVVKAQKKNEDKTANLDHVRLVQERKSSIISAIKKIARAELAKLYSHTFVGRLSNFFKRQRR